MSESSLRTDLLIEADGLRETLESLLGRRYGAGRRVVELKRRPSNYHSSFAIEELEVYTDDGGCLQLVFKDLSPAALLEGALRAKPEFLYHPEREIETYRQVLAPNNLGPNFFGSRVERGEGRYWLFLEKVSGLELYQVGDFHAWCEA
ncbi:MAG: hypothetical protein M3362_05625, partial [Acidobacteriota bacterium]|nr:hypothetical protein [Acidobacteriota bacterium]